MKRTNEIAHEAEIRFVEEGHHTFVNNNGSIKVVSDTSLNVRYTVTYWGNADTGLISFGCTCPAGVNRPHLVVPCKHAAGAGRRLEREGFALWRDGLFWMTPKAQVAAKQAARQNRPVNIAGLTG